MAKAERVAELMHDGAGALRERARVGREAPERLDEVARRNAARDAAGAAAAIGVGVQHPAVDVSFAVRQPPVHDRVELVPRRVEIVVVRRGAEILPVQLYAVHAVRVRDRGPIEGGADGVEHRLRRLMGGGLRPALLHPGVGDEQVLSLGVRAHRRKIDVDQTVAVAVIAERLPAVQEAVAVVVAVGEFGHRRFGRELEPREEDVVVSGRVDGPDLYGGVPLGHERPQGVTLVIAAVLAGQSGRIERIVGSIPQAADRDERSVSVGRTTVVGAASGPGHLLAVHRHRGELGEDAALGAV